MDEGSGRQEIKRLQVAKKPQKRTWPWRRTFFIVFLVICVYESCKLPKVSGVVLDMETGQPVVDAYVQAMYMGSGVSLTSGRSMGIGGGGIGKTDSKGKFSFHSSFFPYPKQGLWLLVYSKDYIPCFSSRNDFKRVLDYWESSDVQREGNVLTGFKYIVHLKKPVTETQWQMKVDGLIRVSMKNWCRDPIDEWYFNDITSFWINYPESYYDNSLVTGYSHFGPYLKRTESAADTFNCDKFRKASIEEQQDFLNRFNAIGNMLQNRIRLLNKNPYGFKVIELAKKDKFKSEEDVDRLIKMKLKGVEYDYQTWEKEKKQIEDCIGEIR